MVPASLMKSTDPARQVGYLVHDALERAPNARALAEELASHGITTAMERTPAGGPAYLVFLDQRRGMAVTSRDLGLRLEHFTARFQENQQTALAAAHRARRAPAQQQFQRQRGG